MQSTLSEIELLYTDHQSGLMWPRNGNIARKRMVWNDAVSWVNALDYGGYSDWRLPSKEELETISRIAGESPSEWFNANGFNDILSSYYWSFSTDPEYSGGAYVLGVGNGYRGYGYKVDGYEVMPVRAVRTGRDAGVDAINDNFKNATDSNKLRSGPVLDILFYDRIKPYLMDAWKEASAHGNAVETLDAFVNTVMDRMGEKVEPYMKKFYREVKAGERAEKPLPKQPRKELDPPYNPVGMAILKAAEKGMSYQGEKTANNPRADRMQKAVEEVQQALSPTDDTPTTKMS